MQPTLFWQISLTSFALTFLFAQTDGPVNVFALARGRIVTAFGGAEWAATGVECLFCAGFWVTLAVSLAFSSPLLWLPALGAVYLMSLPASALVALIGYTKDYSDYVDAMTGRNAEYIEEVD